MLPKAHISHQTSGRLRIRIPSQKGNAAYFASLKERFSSFPGVQKIEVNPLTGSVLVLHTIDLNKIDFKMISEYTEQSGLFLFEQSNHSAGTVSQKVVETFQDANRKVEKFTGGEVDLPTLSVVGLLGVGLLGMARGRTAAPAWHVAFWYALNIFLNSQKNKEAKKPQAVQLQAGQ